MKAQRRQNICFITPNNDRLNESTSFICYFHIYHAPPERQVTHSAPQVCPRRHTHQPPSLVTAQAHTVPRAPAPCPGAAGTHMTRDGLPDKSRRGGDVPKASREERAVTTGRSSSLCKGPTEEEAWATLGLGKKSQGR